MVKIIDGYVCHFTKKYDNICKDARLTQKNDILQSQIELTNKINELAKNLGNDKSIIKEILKTTYNTKTNNVTVYKDSIEESDDEYSDNESDEESDECSDEDSDDESELECNLLVKCTTCGKGNITKDMGINPKTNKIYATCPDCREKDSKIDKVARNKRVCEIYANKTPEAKAVIIKKSVEYGKAHKDEINKRNKEKLKIVGKTEEQKEAQRNNVRKYREKNKDTMNEQQRKKRTENREEYNKQQQIRRANAKQLKKQESDDSDGDSE